MQLWLNSCVRIDRLSGSHIENARLRGMSKMKHRFIVGLLLGAAAGLIAGGVASATPLLPMQLSVSPPANDPSVNVPFPTAGDAYCSATNGCGTIPSGGQTAFQWTTGDYVLSAVFPLPTASVTDLSADWSFQDFLGSGNTETWYAYVNGVAVAAAVLPDDNFMGDILTVTGTVNFSDIAPVAGGYQVELILQNTVPLGGGSVAWLDGGTTGLSFVPEPSSGLLLLGFAVLGFAGMRLPHKFRLHPGRFSA
jgi:hypothetical protein